MAYTQITTLWQNFIGAPGYTRLKFQGSLDTAGVTSALTAIRTFFNSIKAYLPPGVTTTGQLTAQVCNDDGTLLSEVTATGSLNPVAATGTGVWAAGVGAVIFWNTGAIHAGGKVRGRSYLVPLVGSAFDPVNGSLTTTSLQAISTAGTALIAAAPLAVNSRKPPNGTGSNATVLAVSCTVPDRPAVLRSRRD